MVRARFKQETAFKFHITITKKVLATHILHTLSGIITDTSLSSYGGSVIERYA